MSYYLGLPSGCCDGVPSYHIERERLMVNLALVLDLKLQTIQRRVRGYANENIRATYNEVVSSAAFARLLKQDWEDE